MRKFRAICAFFICASMLLLTSCKNIGSFSSNTSELKIGVSGIEGVFNPFYAESEADCEILSQMFIPIQRKGTDNALINYAGGISYEYSGEKGVKYTVSIRDDLFFSDGTNVKIDDVIFFYHFISDATYDGVYKEWYLNDIEGLKEFYFDDKNYKDSLASIENTVKEKYTTENITADDLAKFLADTKVDGLFDGNLESKSPDGSTWKEYIGKSSFASEIEEASKDENNLVELAAKAEAELNADSHNAEEWFRKRLYSQYINKNYSDGNDITEISGIKKINDYTCTVLFNSRNINAVSQLNTFIVSKSFYSTEYVKGSADKVKDIEALPVCSGPYLLAEKDGNEAVLSKNEFYSDFDSDFQKIRFIDLAAKGDDLIKSVSDGKVDIVTVQADQQIINSLSDNLRYQLSDCDYYTSLFFNARTLTDSMCRKGLMGLCNVNEVAEKAIGSYYSRVFLPLSVRFSNYYPVITEPIYNESTFSAYEMFADSVITKITAYFAGSEEDLEYSVLTKYKEILSNKKITLDIVLTDEKGLSDAIISGKADLWIENVYDGATIDKFDYFNSKGKFNRTGLDSTAVDTQTAELREAVGFADRADMVNELLKLVMEYAVEYPLYQRQNVTVYNIETISADSLKDLNEYDSYTYLLPNLKSN